MVAPRDTRIRLEEEAMAGSAVERRQEEQRIAAIKKTQVPTAKEIKAMPTKVAERVRDEIKAGVSTQLATLKVKIDLEFKNAEEDLNAILAESEASTKLINELDAEAARLAAEAKAAEAEGDKTLIDAVNRGEISYTELSPEIKTVFNQQSQYATLSDAGLTAAAAALGAVGVEGLVEVMAEIRRLYPGITSEDALNLL
jgi:hypothetical protein